MFYIKAIIPFTEENRMLASSIVENTKSLFSSNSASSEDKNEGTKRQGAKRQCQSIFCDCDCKRARLASRTRADEKAKFVRVKSQGDAVLRSYNNQLKRSNSYLPKDRFKRSPDAGEEVYSQTSPLIRRNSISSFSKSSSSSRSITPIENSFFTKLTKSAYAKLATSQDDLPSLKAKINSFPSTLRSYDRLPNIRRQKSFVCSRNLSRNKEENELKEEAHSSDETEMEEEAHSSDVNELTEAHSSDEIEMKEEAHSSDVIELKEETHTSEENSTLMVIPTQEASVGVEEITDNNKESENSGMDSSTSLNISETSETSQKINETQHERIDWEGSNLQDINKHLIGLRERMNKMEISKISLRSSK
ncbi:hypothetical protein WA026_006205 [Henosepilachna vigintioctopunctata]|uniref:Uncharacterized protein n=1 Tax=Henosepilachna vigintioctopunctata TaxID=420089 RepID=A0AAW1TJR3_9CUCU